MNIRVRSGDVTQVRADALIVDLFQGVKTPGGATGAIDKALGGAIAKLIASGEIKGRKGEVTLVHVFGQIPAAHVAVLGLGPKRAFDAEVVRNGMAEAARTLRRVGAKRIATIVHGAPVERPGRNRDVLHRSAGGLEPEAAAQAIVEGVILGLYTYKKQVRKAEPPSELRELAIIEAQRSKLRALRAGAERGRIVAESSCLARDMANTPANFMTPTDMARIAREVAREAGLKVRVLEKRDMERLKMGAILGVTKGTVEPPKFIILRHEGAPGGARPAIGLVGKGVTFDTGGISLKPAAGMAAMKTDMSGGACVIGAMRAIGLLKPRVNVVGLVPAAENMPSGSAQKPGDVVTAMNGKTIEVDNTDAEGRLLLADALSYGRRQGLSPMIDVATLTGAMRTSLGAVCTGAFTNHQPACNRLLRAAGQTGEKLWQFPMFDEYKDQNRSDVADVKNTGGASAGSITAALFLQEFAETTPWVHLDIAGTARPDSTRGHLVKGASGGPVRTLVQFALNEAARVRR